MEIGTLPIPRIKMALYIGYRRFKVFAHDCPDDFQQVAAMAALSAQNEPDDHAAFNHIQRIFVRTMREYDYTKAADEAWIRRGRDWQRQMVRKCGLDCTAAGVYKDEKFTYLCRRHHAYVYKRIKKGTSNPYEGLEELDRRGPTRKIAKCSMCGEVFVRQMCKVKRSIQAFCSRKCYEAMRKGGQSSGISGGFFITPHAVERFRERIANLSYEQSLGAIIKGLKLSAHIRIDGHGKGIKVDVEGDYSFTAVLMPPSEGTAPSVVTILPCQADVVAAKDRRKQRRAA